MRNKIILIILFFLLSTATLFAQDGNKESSDKYVSLNDKRPSIEVSKLDQEPNVGFPVDFYDEFASIVVNKLEESEKFSKVVLADENEIKVSDKTEPKNNKTPPAIRYRLSVIITHYSTDKAISWMLLGFRSQEIIKVRINLLDKATGKVILEKEVDGSTSFNFQRIKTPRNITMTGVAKQAVRNIKKAIYK
jgi:hypothetical protein